VASECGCELTLIHALMGYDFVVLFPINPVTLARYREAFTPSRAKDDPTDADLLCELVAQHREQLKVWQPDDICTGKVHQSRPAWLGQHHPHLQSLHLVQDRRPAMVVDSVDAHPVG